MTAFDIAFSLLKEWSPNWRDEISSIDTDIDTHELLTQGGAKGLGLGGGGMMETFKHPNDRRFVAKIPNGWGEGAGAVGKDRDNAIVLALEELGFPVASEKYIDASNELSEGGQGHYNIQPKLSLKNPDWPPDPSKKPERSAHVAHTALAHIIGDRHPMNFGYDTKGRARMLDSQVEHRGADWWPGESNADGQDSAEQYQEYLTNKRNMQLPVTALLDRLPDLDEDNNFLESNTGDQEYLRAQRDDLALWLEQMEPHSDNPPQLTVGGKAIWGDDW
jgi:hypothetical protein